MAERVGLRRSSAGWSEIAGTAFDDEGATVPAVYPKFRRWTTSRSRRSRRRRSDKADFKLYSVDKWGFGQDLGQIRERLDADFVLVTLFHDTRRTGGHVVGSALVGVHYLLSPGGHRLPGRPGERNDGRGATPRPTPGDDLQPAPAIRPEGASDELLTDLYYPPKPRDRSSQAGARHAARCRRPLPRLLARRARTEGREDSAHPNPLPAARGEGIRADQPRPAIAALRSTLPGSTSRPRSNMLRAFGISLASTCMRPSIR